MWERSGCKALLTALKKRERERELFSYGNRLMLILRILIFLICYISALYVFMFNVYFCCLKTVLHVGMYCKKILVYLLFFCNLHLTKNVKLAAATASQKIYQKFSIKIWPVISIHSMQWISEKRLNILFFLRNPNTLHNICNPKGRPTTSRSQVINKLHNGSLVIPVQRIRQRCKFNFNDALVCWWPTKDPEHWPLGGSQVGISLSKKSQFLEAVARPLSLKFLSPPPFFSGAHKWLLKVMQYWWSWGEWN